MNIEPNQLCEIVPCDAPRLENVIEQIAVMFFAYCIDQNVGRVVRTIEVCDVEAVVERIAAQKQLLGQSGTVEAVRAAKAYGEWWHIVDDATGDYGYRPACCLRPLPPLEFILHREEEATA